MECVHGDIKLGVSNDYVGAKAQGTCVTIEGEVRILEIFGKKIYIGGSLDIFSLGVKAGWDVEKKKLELGLSLGAGAGVTIRWEDEECSD